MERCFPAEPTEANPVVRDEFSKRGLTRAVEVAEQILARPEHPDRDRALFVAGKASVALQRKQAGAAFLTRFVTEHPGAAEAGLAHYALAELADDGGDPGAAVPHYRAALEQLDGAAAIQARYQLAWTLHRAGDPAAAADAMAALLAEADGLDDEARAAALQDLENWLAAAGDAARTVALLQQAEGPRAVEAAQRVADDRMADEQWDVADAHYAALLGAWPDDERASRWQVARVDAAMGAGDAAEAAAAVRSLIDGFGPGSAWDTAHRTAADHRRAAQQVEEAARSTIATLHQGRAADGTDGATIEALYRRYLEAYEAADKAHEVRLALAALLQQEGRPLDALDEVIAAVEASAGRDRGAQAARLAMDTIEPQLPDLATPAEGPPTPYEERLLRLAEVFAAGYPRHTDGAAYGLGAGRVRVRHGQLREGIAQLVAVTRDHPTAPEARAAAAAAVHAHFQREDWPASLALADQLLADRRLTAAHPDLGDTLAQARCAARFNQAVIDWEAGDPAGAARSFEALAKEYPDAEEAPVSLLYAATALVEAGDTSRAGMVYRRMYSTYPDHERAPQALEDEAVMRWEKDDFGGAAALLCKLQQDYPDHERAAWALYTAAWLYDQESRFDEAIDCYDRLVRTYPDAPESAEAAPRLQELRE